MKGAKACIKYLLVSFNVIFWLAGLAAVGIGIWMLFDPGRFNEFLGNYTFTIPASILIAAGLFVCFVGFCGCYGAIKENKCMLGTYFTMLLLIFCAEIAAGVLAFLYRDKLKKQITLGMQAVIDDKYGSGDVNIDHAVDLMQQKLECCGATGRGDYTKWIQRTGSKKDAPESCCKDSTKCLQKIDDTEIFQPGCIDKLVTFVKDNMIIMGGVGIGLACVQLLGMCFACCLFFSIDEY